MKNRKKLAYDDDDVTHMSSFFLYPTHLSSSYPTISFYTCFTAKMGLEGSWSPHKLCSPEAAAVWSPPKLCSPEAAAVWGMSDGTLAAFCTVWNIYSILCCSSLCWLAYPARVQRCWWLCKHSRALLLPGTEYITFPQQVAALLNQSWPQMWHSSADHAVWS